MRQLQVSGGIAAGITSSEMRMSDVGRLRVAARNDEERTTKKLSLLLDILSLKLSGELDLDRLLGTVADMTFEVMNVDRVFILLLNDAGERVPRSRGAASGMPSSSGYRARLPGRWSTSAWPCSPTMRRRTRGFRESRS